MPNVFSRLLSIPTNDPEYARKRKLLSLIAQGVVVSGTGILIFSNLYYFFVPMGPTQELINLNFSGAEVIAVSVITLVINRYLSGSLAGMLFLLGMMVFFPFVDTVEHVSNGRSLFVFFIPIIMSSILLTPYSSFFFALLSSLSITLLALSVNGYPNIPAMGGFFLIALIASLWAKSLENARQELVQVNKELDQRVTERTRELSEALLRERAEAGRNQAILEGIADGVVLFDNEGRAILTNPALSVLTGSPAASMLGMKLADMLAHSDLAQTDRQAIHRFIQRPVSSNDNIQVQWGKNTIVINVAPVVGAGGEVIGRVAVFHNFTHQAEVERMKSDFVAMVSHELRTPLNSILGYVDMLREGVYGKLNSTQSGVLERVTTNTRRLLNIVNDLLNKAQIDAGRLIIHYRMFKPVELIDHMNSMVESSVQSKGLDLSIHIADDLPKMLFGDPQRLGQVLVKLVNNAVKFTQQGFIAVRIYRLDAEHWAMEVSDSGIGIAPQAQKSIFDSFCQVSMDATHKHGGIGLGLSIVKHLVMLVQGELCVNSQVGKGSTFTVILPFEPSLKKGSGEVNDSQTDTFQRVDNDEV